MQKSFPVPVFPFLVLSVLGLLAGLWAGLLRIGWAFPGSAHMAASHGPLMVSGFLGTLIILERVVALRRGWMLAAPLLTGMGWLAGLLYSASVLGPLMITSGSLAAVVILLFMVKMEPKVFIVTMAVGAVCWLAGNILWIGGVPIHRAVWFWMAFLVLTIAGERLELSRVLRLTGKQYLLFSAAAGVFLAGAVAAVWLPGFGDRVAGVGLFGLATWLVRYDLARRNLTHPAPLTRYIAVCLFSGYLWLAAGGLIGIAVGAQAAGGLYDAVLHSVLVGFVFSMIFGHAPIILPALLGVMMPFRREFYGTLALLHGSLILRLIGDLTGWHDLRRWGGLLNEVAILLFMMTVILTIYRAKKKR